jgi:competence protein ComEC
MISRSLGHRAPLLWIALPWAAGLVGGKLIPAPLPFSALLAVALLGAGVTLGAAIKRPRIALGALVIGLFAGGLATYELRRDRVADYDELPPREATLTLRLGREFTGAAQADRFSGLGKIVNAPPHLADLVGQTVQVSFRDFVNQAAPRRGTTVIVTGVLEPLPRRSVGDGGFDDFLIDLGLNFSLGRGALERVVAEPGRRERARARGQAWIYDQLGRGPGETRPDVVAALRGMLLGLRSELSDTQENLFLRTGTMHLFAISGLHIGAIALGLHGLLRGLRVPRRTAFGVGAAVLWAYVEVVGAPPSAVRAFLMVTCVQVALVWPRAGNPVAGLATSAALVLVIDPMQLFGAGFQMSYGIVAALLLYGLPLGEAWQQRWALWQGLPKAAWSSGHHFLDSTWRKILGIAALAVAASLVSALSTPQFFGLFTPAALLINPLFIPLAILAVFAGFLALACGALSFGPGAVLFAHAGALIVAVMQWALEWINTLPGVAWETAPKTAWWGGLAQAGLLGLLVWGYAHRWQRSGGGWWPPVIWVGLMLVTGLKFA